MDEIDLNDRAGLEQVYPLDAFEQDATRNSLPNAAVLHGLRIVSGADAAGRFEITRTKQQVAERDPEGDTVFLAPQTTREGAGDWNLDPAAVAAAPAPPGPDRDAYRAFIDRVIGTARDAKFKKPVGRDERLRGFHGG